MGADRDRLIGFAGAVLVHVVLIGLLAFSMSQRTEKPTTPNMKPIVQARAVSEEQVMAPVRAREAEEAARQQRIAEQKRQAAEEKRRAEEAKRQAEAEAKRKAAEKARLAALKKQQAAEKARLAAEAKKAEAERQHLAELKRKQEAERRAAEERKKVEQARQQREAAEQQRREAELQAKMAAEAERLAQEQQRYRQQQLNNVRAQYMADIRNKVERNWLRPSGSKGTFCRVRVTQIPGGEIIDVTIVESDGDVAFQRSVEAALRKASPLPAPSDPEVFDREIEFVFEP